jgi:putative peptide zinc metalloprotease protein
MSAYLDEPYMRRRSRQVLLGKLRGGSYAKVENDVLAAYSLASTAYVLLVVAMLLLLLGRVFELHLGGVVFLPLAVIAVPVAWRMIGKFREIARSFERKAQFQRWRKGDLPKGEAESEGKIHLNSFARYSLRSFGLLLLVVLILPYDHEIGGGFVVLPQEKQDITSEVSGIIESINYDGGEVLRQGTVIGRLSCTDYNAQVKILSAKIAEQDAVIAELKARPRPEEVELAESNLRTEETRARFSKEELARMEKLYAEKTVSFEDLEDARREHELDVKRVAEKRASLELIKAGATPDEITAAEAKLQSWEEERRLYLEKIEKSVFYTPLEGTLVAMHLKQKIGSYFERGQPLATVENTQQVIVQIDVAEEDIGYIRDKAKVRVRFPTYSEEDIDGTVTLIGPTVTEGSAGRVLQITAQIENRDGKLKSGMEGYAKISCGSLPVWKVLTLGVIRFFNIEAWSWLP